MLLLGTLSYNGQTHNAPHQQREGENSSQHVFITHSHTAKNNNNNTIIIIKCCCPLE